MAEAEVDVIDSQIVAENVGFLDNCFDNSFALQSSLIAVKEYIAEEQTEQSTSKNHAVVSCKKINTCGQNTTIALSSSSYRNTQQISQPIENAKLVNRSLKDWGLPHEIARKYEQRGITEMFEWQVTCLSNPKVLMDCCNLVYSAPTSAGKTLVAEILTIKTILERHKKVIIILPFVSIVREKMFYLQDILSSSGIRVEGFMGSQSPPGGLLAVHIAICTIEKANSLVNRLLDDGNISELGAVIVDELHLLGDTHRGYILELLLTKIKYVSSKLNDVQIQIVGMSATLPNLEVLAGWLDAELFITDFRPIPLEEFCLVGNKYYDRHGKCVSIMENTKSGIDENDHVLKICLNTIQDGCSVLIFCMTKNRCENLAQNLASSFYKLGCAGSEMGTILRKQLNSAGISEVLEQLKNCPVGLDQIIKNSISFGVAYHHAGLTFDERDIIEGAFKSGAIRVLVATSTLSSGVNLPARKVIIRSPVFQRLPINILTYKQMIGRAGRMGKDTKGESILICTENEKKIGFDLMMGALDSVKSCIECEDKYMRAVLEMIASQVACTKAELDLYSKCTLLFTQQNISPSQNILLDNTLKELRNFELVRVQTDLEDEQYVATPLGKACLSSSMAPNDGLSLFCELQKARQCLVLETDLHLIYLVTPYSVSSQWGNIDWLHLLTLWENLTKAMKRVGELAGIQESFIIRCLRGTTNLKNVQNKLNIHKRFYTALALQDLVNEVPLTEVATKFQCARGFLQGLQQAAATFAGMVTAFCHQLGWKNMEMLVSQFQDRLHFGIHSELLELMKLPSLNGMRARTLFDAGFETISSIASSDVNVIENTLHKAIPFQSEKEREGDDSTDIRKRNKIKNIWITGCCGMSAKEAAENLILEARKYLEREIGVTEIKWNNVHVNSIMVANLNTITEPIKNMTVKLENNESMCNAEKNKLTNMIGEPLSEDFHVSNITKCNECSDSGDFYVNAEVSKSTISIKNDLIRSLKEEIVHNSDTCNEVVGNILIVNNTKLSSSGVDVVEDEKAEIKSISFINDVTDFGDSPSILKDEIIWDSMNYTEVAFANKSKLCSSAKISSPNISFGDRDSKSMISNNDTNHIVSSKSKSVKDVSLFSSEGDNSSLFEDSLPFDLIPSKILDDKSMPTSTPVKQETTTDFISINSKSILNAFKSTIVVSETDDDEDFKLVYEEENKISENEVEGSFSLSQNIEEIDTQEVDETLSKNKFKSPLKRHALTYNIQCSWAKKGKMESYPVIPKLRTNGFKSIVLKYQDSKTFTLEVNKQKLKCFVLRGNDIFENLHEIDSIQEVSVYLNIKSTTALTSNELIGSSVLRQSRCLQNATDLNGSVPLVKGIMLYSGQKICIYIDLASLGDQIFPIKTKLSKLFQSLTTKLKMTSLKENYIHIKKCFGIDLLASCLDISLAEWLIDSDEKIPNIAYLTKKYIGIDLSTVSMKIDSRQKKFKFLDTIEALCVKAWCAWEISDKQEQYLLEQYHSVRNTIDTEIKVSKILANCEYNGLTVDKDLSSQLLIDVRKSQEILQKKAYKICGFYFNFNSSKDVAKVLGIYKGRKVSTKKSVLTSHNSPISSIVIYWRKLNSILTKTLYPLTEKACMYSEGNRINPTYTMFTCTGRISMHEPNLQNVPRTFSIPAKYLSDVTKPCDDVIEFNCRNIFRAAPGHVLVSADYCQLEMRILAHYSEDEVLMNIMRSDVDVFKSIAASWGNVPESEVDDDLRQKTKQLCYGILYGMGNKTLSQHLDVTEAEAAMFMDSFYQTYPGVREFTRSVVDACRRRGYVETLMKRRRYLPDINSIVGSKKSAAERQAVNTTIQGSAADIAKAAMCAIDTRTEADICKPRLILQMHDELIYEVLQNNQMNFINILKQVMEETVWIKVPLPVKVRSGYTWGSLEEIKF